MRKNQLLYSISFLLITGFIVKILGLLNKIILTRTIGLEGLNLYTLAYPTILLFSNIASLSLKEAIAKIVSENIALKCNIRNVIIKSLKIVFWVIIFLSLIILFIKQPLALLLGNALLENLFLIIIPLIILIGLQGVMKGYLIGIKCLDVIAKAQLFEQIFRIISCVILTLSFLRFGLYYAVLGALLSLCIGECASLLYLFINIKKRTSLKREYIPNNHDYKRILKIAIPLSSTKLIASLAFFLEPILFSLALGKIGLNNDVINDSFAIMNGYVLPTLTLLSFIAFGIAQAIVPSICEANALRNFSKTNKIINTSLLITFMSSMFFLVILYFFSSEVLVLLYQTDLGANYLHKMALIFILYYLNIILGSVVMVSDKSNDTLIITLFSSIIKMGLIYFLSLNPNINVSSLSYAISISLFVSFILYYSSIRKNMHFHFSIKNFIPYFFSIIVVFFFIKILRFKIPYIPLTILSFLIYISLLFVLVKPKSSYNVSR